MFMACYGLKINSKKKYFYEILIENCNKYTGYEYANDLLIHHIKKNWKTGL